MPYIKEDERHKFEDADGYPIVCELADRAGHWGDINYLVTSLIDQYLYRCGVNYASLNGAIGVLECCKQELYRRVLAPYEDTKIKENGDVFRDAVAPGKASG